MARLTTNQVSFIKLMAKSDEHARRGFELLLMRPGFETFFETLDEVGMFEPVHNPGPVPANRPMSTPASAATRLAFGEARMRPSAARAAVAAGAAARRATGALGTATAGATLAADATGAGGASPGARNTAITAPHA